ncbi:ubiquitin carboxyl-terminal hydrolase [Anaeramoeba flamelloides]|uniref:ubiquitinyl hydrolase 1 n=1 Tax=Anaeramoeba flamelloides TaxID=1746091 RepID=A0AAV7ZNM6_9EUKA|nr:ubiquitin carboxyl-terminal hydrolase [Anaeramoeba flamelloides]
MLSKRKNKRTPTKQQGRKKLKKFQKSPYVKQKTQNKVICKKNLHDASSLQPFMKWKKKQKIGKGLVNLGNTCFLNSVLQCLTYIPIFTQYLLSGDHSKNCKSKKFCILCALEQHVKNVFFRPNKINQSLRYIVLNVKKLGKSIRIGRQEDAHEFLLALLEYAVDSILFHKKRFVIFGFVFLFALYWSTFFNSQFPIDL